MTYRCGIYEPLASIMGVEPGGPRITCDGCGIVSKLNENRPPPVWFLDNKAPPRWMKSGENETRRDWCPSCKIDRLVAHPATAKEQGE